MNFAQDVAASPELYPLALDPVTRAVRMLRLGEAGYAQASFLDERIARAHGGGELRSWMEVAAAAAALPVRCDFIFHTSRVGSTLLSRLLGEHPSVFSLREPAALRQIAAMREHAHQGPSRVDLARDADAAADTLLRLWSRTWRPQQKALIKATSFVSEMAQALLARVGGSRAILMFVTPLTFLSGIVGREESRAELRMMAPARLLRLHRALGIDPGRVEGLSDGEMVAMTWLCEMTALHRAAQAPGARTLWINFDQFLVEPAAGLSSAFAHLDVPADEAAVDRLLHSPIMGRYSKAPEHAYDADLRRKILLEGQQTHGPEIRKGMDWLGRAALASLAARAVLEAAARVRIAPAARPAIGQPVGGV